MTLDLDGPLWAFARVFYRHPGVESACLILQDEAEVDIIQLIVLLYTHAVLGRSLSATDISAMRADMAGWRSAAVLPLRNIRRALKPGYAGIPDTEKTLLRTQIKKAELLAEQIQLALALRWLEGRAAGVQLHLKAALRPLLAGFNQQDQRISRKLSNAIDIILEAVSQMGANGADAHGVGEAGGG